MAFTLAFLEAGSVFAAVCLLMSGSAHPFLLDGLGIPAIVAPALAVSVCCLVSFYYNDLYELPALQDLWGVAPRLMQSLGAVFLIVAVGYPLLPGGQVSLPLLARMFVLVVGLVLPLRAMSYGLIARRAPGERVVILGSGPLAQKIA
jgi:putative flippase GtrA